MPGMADEMLLASQRAFPRVATDLGYQFALPDLGDALTALR
jgi:NAD dependent epimerase/dehydratase family enzyme